ncbi:MAG: hypothetical protein ACI9PP_000729 [Halobacteriales archaeon]|jgi:hypothetical protein
MGLVAEYEIYCEGLPLVAVADDVPDATFEISIQFNHGDRPPFIVHATGGSPDSIAEAFESATFVGD